MHYKYVIDLDERGQFQAHVEDHNGKTVWEVSYPEYYQDDETGEEMENSTIFDDGYMKDTDDLEGLENYLKQMGTIPQEAELKSENDFDDDDDDDDEYAQGGYNPAQEILDSIYATASKSYRVVADIGDGKVGLTAWYTEAVINDVIKEIADKGYKIINVEEKDDSFMQGGEISEYKGIKSFTVNFKTYRNFPAAWRVIFFWGGTKPFVEVTKVTNNPFGGRLGTDFETLDKAIAHYKSPEMKVLLMQAADVAKKAGVPMDMFAYGGMMADGGEVTNAILLIVDAASPLSSQVQKITGDPLNTGDYKDIGVGNFNILTHKKSGQVFVVYPKRIYDQLPNEAKQDDIDYLQKVEKISFASGGEVDMLKEDDMVWNAFGHKLEVDKVTKDEYYLRGFMQPSASPFSKQKVHKYLKNGEWSLKPKMADGGMMEKGGETRVSYKRKLDFLKYILSNTSKFNSAIKQFPEPKQQEIKNLIKDANKFYAEDNSNKKKFNEIAIPLYKKLYLVSEKTWAKITRKYNLDIDNPMYLMQQEDVMSDGGSIESEYKYAVYFNRMANGKRIPVVTAVFKTKEEAKNNIGTAKGYTIKEIDQLPVESEIVVTDEEKEKSVKNIVHSKERVDEFFKGKDGFYKRKFGWVKPYGYKWDNWQLVKGDQKMADGGVTDFNVIYYESMPTRGGNSFTRQAKRDSVKDTLENATETARKNVSSLGYEYADVLDAKKNAIAARIKKDGSVMKYADGGEVKWQNADTGDSALVKAENKLGVIMKAYGRKFHLKFVDGTEKTYDANELTFFEDEEMARGGMAKVDKKYTHFAIGKNDGKIVTGWEYKGLDRDEIKNYTKMDLEDMDFKYSDFRIVTAKKLKSEGIDPFSWDNWRKTEQMAKGGDVKKQEWVAVYVNQEKPSERKVIQAFGNTKEEATRNVRMSEGYYGIKRPFELIDIYTYSGNTPMMAKGGVIGSSPTKEGIEKVIGKYYYSSNISLHQRGDTNEYDVHNAKGKVNGVKVVEKKGRYQFVEDTDKMADGGKVSYGKMPALHLKKLLANGKYAYEKGDEGMYEGDEVRVTKRSPAEGVYEYDILDENGKVKKSGNLVNEDNFEKQFRYFPKMKGGGKTKSFKEMTFKEKSASIQAKLKGSKVSPKYRKKYGKTYDSAEAKEAADAITGKIVSKMKE